jgi:hypothetical protein
MSKVSFVPIRQESSYAGTSTKNKGSDNRTKGLSKTSKTEARIGSDVDDEDSDDGNAWCGCVCGQTHQKKTVKHPEIFWIQCDVCGSWYDCSSTCVGFTSNDAETKSRWTCWGCPSPESDPSSTTTNTIVERSKPSGRVSLSPVAMESTTLQSTLGDADKRLESSKPSSSDDPLKSVLSIAAISPNQHDAPVHLKEQPTTSGTETKTSISKLSTSNELSQEPEKKSDDDCSVFMVNDMVYVQEHSWARVNNPEGIANVVKAYIDDDGDQVYDIRYVVGGKANGVLPEYLTRYFFS